MRSRRLATRSAINQRNRGYAIDFGTLYQMLPSSSLFAIEGHLLDRRSRAGKSKQITPTSTPSSLSRRRRVFNLEAHTSAGVSSSSTACPIKNPRNRMRSVEARSSFWWETRVRIFLCNRFTKQTPRSNGVKSGAKRGRPICPTFDSNFQLNSSRETFRDA